MGLRCALCDMFRQYSTKFLIIRRFRSIFKTLSLSSTEGNWSLKVHKSLIIELVKQPFKKLISGVWEAQRTNALATAPEGWELEPH